MKNITRKIIAVFAVLCVAVTSMASCSGKNNDSSSTSINNSGDSSSYAEESIDKESLMRQPLNIGSAGDGNIYAGDADLDGDDPVASAPSTDSVADTTKFVEVTDANNQPVTQVVEVTNADGEKQTDADNKPVTEVVKVTEAVTVPASETPSNTPANSDYKSKNDGRYAMWIDCSENKNFLFEGEMLKATFKVKEGIPDGDYRIRISPDLSDVAGVSVYPSKVIDGTIRVNNGAIEPVDVSDENGSFVFYGDNIACKQGDTIDFNINVKNNAGIVAFCIWFYFDSNALEFVEAGATGEYADIAQQTEIGNGSKKQ